MSAPAAVATRRDPGVERAGAAFALAVQLVDVWKSFLSGVHVLQGASLQVTRGDTVVIEGHTGVGKTTLLRLVAGIERPDGGKITVNGTTVSAAAAAALAQVRRTMGMFLVEMPLLGHLTVEENLLLALRAARCSFRERRIRVYEALKLFGLEGRRHDFPDRLSAGGAQLACLARMLAPRPALILADEPTALLDRATADSVLGVLRNLQTRGVTAVIASHDSQVASQLGARRVILRDGKLDEVSSGRGRV